MYCNPLPNTYLNNYKIKQYNNTYYTTNTKTNTNTIKPILKFQLLSNSDFVYDKYKLSKFINHTNTDCQTVSGTAPMPPPCSIL